jgi:hypothetical protein
MIWRATIAAAHRKKIAFIALRVPTGRGRRGGRPGTRSSPPRRIPPAAALGSLASVALSSEPAQAVYHTQGHMPIYYNDYGCSVAVPAYVRLATLRLVRLEFRVDAVLRRLKAVLQTVLQFHPPREGRRSLSAQPIASTKLPVRTYKATNAIQLSSCQPSRSVVRTLDCGSWHGERSTLLGVNSILFADAGVVALADDG